MFGGLWTCPIHAITGLYCPGCGMTRAVIALAELDPATALRQNVLVLVVLPLLLGAAITPTRLNAWLDAHRTPVIIVAAALTTAFTIARNSVLPGLAPF